MPPATSRRADAARGRTQPFDNPSHPRGIRWLDAFGIPYCAIADGGDSMVSSDTRQAIAEGWLDDGDVSQAIRLGRRVLEETPQAEFGARPVLRTRLPTASATVALAGYAMRDQSCGDHLAIVLFERTAAPGRVTWSALGLTVRESEVASHLAAGFSTKEIGARLSISHHTARHHTERVFQKLGVQTRAAVAAVLVTSGLMRTPTTMPVEPPTA